MRFISRTRKSGNSLIVTIPFQTVKKFNLKENIDVSLVFHEIVRTNLTRRFRCLKCGHIFTTSDIIPYCPIDGCEDLEEEFEG